MSLGRLLMLFGLLLLPMALIYGMSQGGGLNAMRAMYIELLGLMLGAVLFVVGRRMDKSRS
jgi:hypothetical protein